MKYFYVTQKASYFCIYIYNKERKEDKQNVGVQPNGKICRKCALTGFGIFYISKKKISTSLKTEEKMQSNALQI